jgi:hypothetical protein
LLLRCLRELKRKVEVAARLRVNPREVVGGHWRARVEGEDLFVSLARFVAFVFDLEQHPIIVCAATELG